VEDGSDGRGAGGGREGRRKERVKTVRPLTLALETGVGKKIGNAFANVII